MSRSTFRRRLPWVFYGWWVVLGALLLRGLGEGLLFHSFGAYFVYLQAEFGWSRTVISGAASMGRVETGFLGPLQAWLINRFGPRAVIRVGLVLFGLGFVALSQIDSVSSFYLAYLGIALGSSLCGFFTVNITLANWFERRRALAMSLAGTGTAIAGLLVPTVAWALSTFGWRATAVVSGVFIVLVGLPVAQLIRHAPEPYGYTPDGARQPDSPSDSNSARGGAGGTARGGLSAREALHTPAFWLLCSGHAAALLAVSALMVHLIPYLVEEVSMSLQAAAGVVAAVTVLSTAGHLVAGFLGDRFEKRLICAACMLGHTVGLLLLTVGDPLAIYGFAVVHGLAWGARGPLMSAVRADYFGRRSFATIEGFASLITMVGVVTGPLLAGFLADYLGNYRLGFVLLAAVTATGAAFFASARRPPEPVRPAFEPD